MKDSNQKILAGAFRLFLKNNYESVSTKMLEMEIGLSRGSIFYHSKDKQSLFNEVIDTYILAKQDVAHKIKLKNLDKKPLYDYINEYIEGAKSNIDSMREIVGNESIVYGDYFSLLYQAKRYYTGFADKIAGIFERERCVIENVVKNSIERGELKEGLTAQDVAKHLRYIFVGNSFEESLNSGVKIKEIRSLIMSYYNLIKK